MWSIIVILVLCFLVILNIMRVMIYGKGILRPNFRRVDEKFTARTGFGSKWNSPFGKIVYYFSLVGLISLLAFFIRRLIF